MTVLAGLTVLAVLESTLPSFRLPYKIQHNEATVAVLTVLAVSAVMAVSFMTATPLNSTPLFRDPEKQGNTKGASEVRWNFRHFVSIVQHPGRPVISGIEYRQAAHALPEYGFGRPL